MYCVGPIICFCPVMGCGYSCFLYWVAKTSLGVERWSLACTSVSKASSSLLHCMDDLEALMRYGIVKVLPRTRVWAEF